MAADDGSPTLSQIGKRMSFGVEPAKHLSERIGRMSRLKSTRRVEAAPKGAVFCKALAGGSANAAKPNAQAATQIRHLS